MRPRSLLLFASLLCVAAGVLLAAPPAAADTTGRGTQGQRLTVSKSAGLNPAGETVTISGSGYDTNKGIYVAFCVDTGAGNVPSPCGGGADTSGTSGASHWISSNPPSYGEGLAEPYGAGGSFRVTLRITPVIGTVDCRTAKCAVVTRADHTRTSDRTQDVRVRVTFAGAAAPAPGKTTTKPPAPGRRTTAPVVPPAVPSAAQSAAAAPTLALSAPPSATPGPTQLGDIQVTRVSASQSANRWWTGVTAVLAASLVGLVVAGVLARRRRRKAAAR